MTALVRVLTGKHAGEVFPLTEGVPLTVGRDPTSTIVLAGDHVSREHACFHCLQGAVSVENRSQVNRLFVNGQPVPRADLHTWDTIVVGPTVLRLEDAGHGGGEHALFTCLLELGRILGQGGDRLIERSLEALFIALPVTRLALFTLDAEGQPVQGPTSTRGNDTPARMSHGFVRRVLEAGHAILLEAESESSSTTPATWNRTLRLQAVRTVLGVPVEVHGATVAVLLGDNLEQPGLLDRTHLQVMEWAAKALENVFQRDELRRLEEERLRNEYEREAGRSVQQYLVTCDPRLLDGPWHWAATYRPALDLGGDYYGFHRHSDGSVTWLVADVSGKGVPAALVAAMIKAATAAIYDADGNAGPRHLLMGLHRLLRGQIPPTMFFTAIALRAYPDGAIVWANAGHPSGVIVRATGGVEHLVASQTMLGMLPLALVERRLEEPQGRLEAGDRLHFFTDGVTEAMTLDQEQFGEERTDAALVAITATDPGAVITALVAALEKFSSRTTFDDDVTVVVGIYGG